LLHLVEIVPGMDRLLELNRNRKNYLMVPSASFTIRGSAWAASFDERVILVRPNLRQVERMDVTDKMLQARGVAEALGMAKPKELASVI
jgi:hypothetical protein